MSGKRERGRRSRLAAAVAAVTAGVGASGLAAAAPSTPARLPGSWSRLPAAPLVSPNDPRVVTVWTGRKLFVFARTLRAPEQTVNSAALYTPALGTWKRLSPPPGISGAYEGVYNGAWTGSEIIVMGPTVRAAYAPATNRWRVLPRAANSGFLMAWTGRELITWGGGCCGDASASGTALTVATNTVRALPPSPLAPTQRPIGAWTGRELIVLVNGVNPLGGTFPARYARAAAYRPATRTWRRIAPLPVPLSSATAVWDGDELLLAGAGRSARATLAYDPVADRWRALRPMPTRAAGSAVRAGKRLMVWRGRDALVYAPIANRWSRSPQWPHRARPQAGLAWTGSSLFAWADGGGDTPRPGVGAVFTPRAP